MPDKATEPPVVAEADDHSGDLLARWRAGDQQAAEILFRRYTSRLIALARGRLPMLVSRRVDAEDVVQSVFRSFFAEARDGHYDLSRGGDLWRLLVTITLHKLQNQVKHNQRDKRAVERERSFGSEDSLNGLQAFIAQHQPSSEAAVALADQLEQFMRGLEPLPCRMLELRLQGFTLAEIAAATNRSDRTVIRIMERIKLQLEQGPFDDTGS